jgi:hypothetical protein
VFNPGNAIPKALSGVRFVDNGDSTVSDTLTGLMWEKKENLDTTVDLSNPHDADNKYSWTVSASPYPPDGTAFTDFLARLNSCASSDGTATSGGFAGHCDWRLPTSIELQSILLAPYTCGISPCISSVFGATQPGYYWSTTIGTSFPDLAWTVYFDNGFLSTGNRPDSFYVRAVRGGS